MSPTSTRSPRRDAVDNRAALVAAARVVFARDPEASLDVVAVEAGLSRRAVYGHFANRDELQREVVTQGSQRLSSALAAVDHPDPVIRLALIGTGLWREVASLRVMALFAVRGAHKQHTAAGLAPLRRTVLDAVTEAMEMGVARTDIPADRLARLVEDAALSVLDESTRSELSAAEGHRLVIQCVLGALGIGWRDANTLIDTTPELKPTPELAPTPELKSTPGLKSTPEPAAIPDPEITPRSNERSA
jgi:AcrR family transcriptional regulator